MVNIYEISINFNINSSTLERCLFGAVSFTKNADIGKYEYSGYGIGFDRHGFFSSSSCGTGRNVITFGVDMSSSTMIDNRKKDILILGKGSILGLEHKLSAKNFHSINVTGNKKNLFELHYNGANSYLFINNREIYKFKAKDSENFATPSCLGNISKDWTVNNMKKIALIEYVYDFSAHFDAIVVNDILDIHTHLTKKNNMIQK